MKSSRFIAGLIVIVAVQIGIFAASQYLRLGDQGQSTTAVEVAEADAARIFSRALVSELQRDPDYELRERLLTQAKLQAIEVIRRSRASPTRTVMTLTKLDELVHVPATTATTERWAEQIPRQSRVQDRYDRRPRGRLELSEEKKLLRDLDRQVVPRQLSDISRMLDHYDTRRVQERGHQRDQTF